MKAVLNDVVLAEAPREELVSIEGNWYFPPESVSSGLFVDSDTAYTCPWKGECRYFSIRGGTSVQRDRAWCYPHPYPGAFERVGRDFSGYVAFDPAVTMLE